MKEVLIMTKFGSENAGHKKKVTIKRVSKYTGITALISILMATGCTSISQYFKGWTITIKPAQTGSETGSDESSVSAQTGSEDTTSPVYESVSSDSTQYSGAH